MAKLEYGIVDKLINEQDKFNHTNDIIRQYDYKKSNLIAILQKAYCK